MTATAIGWRGKPRKSKYGAVRTQLDGVTFASKAEANRWSELRLLERAGQIHNLRRQPKFPLYVGDWLIGHYVGDFAYHKGGKLVVEDVKGTTTPLFDWKSLHFHAQYGFAVEVVR